MTAFVTTVSVVKSSWLRVGCRLTAVAVLIVCGIVPARAAVGPLTWSRVAVTATNVAVAPSGELYALSSSPTGVDKDILRDVNGTWTVVTGLTAASIAVGVDGTLYAANAPSHGVYELDGTAWKSLDGGALEDVTTSSDGSLYALGAAADSSGDRYVWRKLGAGAWTRQAATGVSVTGSFDPATYAVAGVGAVKPGGYFVLKSSGAIYYYLSSGAYVHVPGLASAVTPVTGGFFALHYPAVSSGARLIYFDYATAKWSLQNDAGTALAAGHANGGPWSQLYLVTSGDDLYTAPLEFSVTPKFSQYPLASSKSLPFGIALGADGALWFAEYGSTDVGRITTAGKVSTFSVVTASESTYGGPALIAAGPGNALWFTTEFNGLVGRITTAGAVSRFPIDAGKSEPTGITAGPDGAMWFTNPDFDPSIGRITASGSVSAFGLASSEAAPLGIAAGADGALWFTITSGKIGRITTTGSVKDFPIVPKTAHTVDPTYIAAGPDGALWFTEQNDHVIGRITTAGAITEYPVPTAKSGPNAIAAGPDGALWFVETSAKKFGRITTAGAFTEYPLPTSQSAAAALTTGPDGALWYTESSSGAIGHLTLH